MSDKPSGAEATVSAESQEGNPPLEWDRFELFATPSGLRIKDQMSGEWQGEAYPDATSAFEECDRLNAEAERKAAETLLNLSGSLWRW